MLAMPLLAALVACTGHERERPRDEPPRVLPPVPPPPSPPPLDEPPPEPPEPSRCFAARRDIGLPRWPLSSIHADVDGDERLDLLVNYSLDARVGVLLADDAGGLREPAREHVLERDAIGLVVGDFDGDGRLDLAASDARGPNVRVYAGRGDGTFASRPIVTRVGKHVGAGVADDFTADGRADLVVTLWRDLAVLDGRGDGRFSAARRMTAGQAPEPPIAADFNNDGRFDLAAASNDEHHLSLFLARGFTGKFEPARRTPCGRGGHALVADDLDGDGELDLAMANIHSHDVCVLRGDGRGGLAVAAVLPAGYAPHGLAAGDVTGDGHVDLVVAAWGIDTRTTGVLGDGAVIVLAGDGDGGFATRAASAVGASPNDLWLDDLDRDGHLDAITLNSNARSVTILRGAPCPTL